MNNFKTSINSPQIEEIIPPPFSAAGLLFFLSIFTTRPPPEKPVAGQPPAAKRETLAAPCCRLRLAAQPLLARCGEEESLGRDRRGGGADGGWSEQVGDGGEHDGWIAGVRASRAHGQERAKRTTVFPSPVSERLDCMRPLSPTLSPRSAH